MFSVEFLFVRELRIMKVSVLLPVKNGMPYLPSAIESFLAISQTEIELIVSDNGSTDGSWEYLENIRDERITVLLTPGELTMSEHWNLLAARASGMWQMFLGQDDALQLGFYEIVEKLTSRAEELGIRSVVCRRAYYFWPGTENFYNSQRVRYVGWDETKIYQSRAQLVRCLEGHDDYFNLPHMYTTSLFHRDLIRDAKDLMDGNLIDGHPQDAFLAAIACMLEPRYLRSEVPFAWVGSSTKSAGLAVSHHTANLKSELGMVRASYLGSIQNSPLPYSASSGSFELALPAVYLWSATKKIEQAMESRGKFFEPLEISLSRSTGRSWVSLHKALRTRARRALISNFLRINHVSEAKFVFFSWSYFAIGWFRGLPSRWIKALLLGWISAFRPSGYFVLRIPAGGTTHTTIREASREVYSRFSSRLI